MKRFGIILAFLIIVSAALSSGVSAATWKITENPPVSVPFASPTIDGKLDTTDGWSDAAKLDEQTSGYFYLQNPLTGYAELFFAYDNAGLYFAADITEVGAAYSVRFYDADGNTEREVVYPDKDAGTYTLTEHPAQTPDGFVYDGTKIDEYNVTPPGTTIVFWKTWSGDSFIPCTGEDDIDLDANTGANLYGFNGDVFTFMLDPADKFVTNGFVGDFDYTAWYNVGLFEDGSARMYRSRVNDGDITDSVKVEAKTTSGGWCFEAFIPWDILVKDANDLSARKFTITKDDIIAAAQNRAAMMWLDRFNDSEANMIDTWGRFITVNETSPDDGELGNLSEGECLDAYGLRLSMQKQEVGDTTAPPTAGTTAAPSGNTTTKAPVTNTAKGGPASSTSAATFDAGIAAALGALAVSTIGFGFAKSKKHK